MSQKTKKIIWKNILVLAFVFTTNYVSYNGLVNLQSSLHRDEGMGTLSTSSRYVAFMLSSMFFAATMIRLCGHKWTVVLSLFSFLFWTIANGVGIWATMIPASVLSGLFSAPLWTAQGSYITELAKEYALVTNQDTNKIATIFIGVFGSIYALSVVISDTISYTVLQQSEPENYSIPTDVINEICGINDCPYIEQNNTYFSDPPKSVVWTLLGIYTVFVFVAIAVCIIFLDPLPKIVKITPRGKLKDEIISGLLASLRLMKDYRLWLLVPINAYSSSIQSFRTAEFNGSWVTCALGIWMVGLINMPGNLILSPTNFLTGYVSKILGRVIPIVLSFSVALLILLTLFFWQIVGDALGIFFTVSVGFGLSEGILDTIVQAAHGFVFAHDPSAGFACYNFFWCLTAAITYGYSYYLCSNVKLFIVLLLLFVGFIFYLVLEWDISRFKKGNITNEEIKSVKIDIVLKNYNKKY